MSIVQHLEKKLEDKELSTGPRYDFVPKVHDHQDLSKWFCESFHALHKGDSAKLYDLANAFRKGVWDVVENVEHVHEFDSDNPKLEKLVKEMVRIMKFRVVSYERTTKRIVTYTRTMIDKARKLAQSILDKQDELSKHIQTQALELKKEKIGQLPNSIETTIVIEEPSFTNTFQMRSNKREMMDALKKRAVQLYKQLHQLQEERVQAVLNHDKVLVRNIDAKTKLIKTYTRAIMGARQHFSSIHDQEEEEEEDDETGKKVLERLEKSMAETRVPDYELYKQEVEHQIDEHSSGLALYLGLKTQHEITQLKQDLVTEVCKVVSKIFDEGREEIMLLNQEMASFHRELLGNQVAMQYLEKVAKKYRASVAKIQLQLLALFDKR